MGLLDSLRKRVKSQEQTQTDEREPTPNELEAFWEEHSPESILPIKQLSKYLEEKQKAEPTHWIYKFVKNSEEYRCRSISLVYSMRGDFEKCLEFCNKGLKINPKSPYLLYIKGRTKGDISDFKGGLSELDRAIKFYPNFADAYIERGSIKAKLGDSKGAEKDYSTAKKIEPSIIIPKMKMVNTEETQKLINKIMEVLSGIEPDYSNAELPKEIKTLSKKGVKEVVNFLHKNEDKIHMLYGSFPLMAQVLPEFRRIPGDIDIQLNVGEEGAKKLSLNLVKKLKEVGEKVRINPEKPVIIDSFKNGKWERAVDIHHAEEEPEDMLSPLFPIENLSNPPISCMRTREQALQDALDGYAANKTLIELAKKIPSRKADAKKAEKLLERYKELFVEDIDFDKMKIKKISL